MRPLLATTLSVLFLALTPLACGDDEPETTTVTETTTETTTTTTTTTTDEEDAENGGDGGGGPTGTRNCGDVAFQPQSDAGAFDISATNVDCGTARAVAAAAEGERGGAYSAEGFECSGVRQGGPLPTVEYTCTSGAAEITFSAS